MGRSSAPVTGKSRVVKRSIGEVMRFIAHVLIFATGYLLISLLGWTILNAQEETQTLFHVDIFGKPRRAGVVFSHEMHMENLSDAGCGVCHHSPDSRTGELVYLEDDEQSCKECHGFQEQGGKPALQEAYHGSCTVCHRRLIQSRSESSGPITCGECHRNE